ncbi:MAG: 4Fe-4S binding protein [Deltaproteobacteria bacterium]|nr:4Fe-4S binding protein [Deltaproteobacteria bacterium]
MADFGQYLANIKNSAVSIFEGMAVTFSWMFRRPTTIQYPDRSEKPVRDMIPERSRGVLEVDVKTCIGDLQCQRVCPIGVILIEMDKAPDGKGRVIKRFDIDVSKCMYCGFCTEVCPTNAMRHTHEFEGCSRDIRNLVLHFVDEPVPPYKLQKDVTPPTPPLGEILRTRVLRKWDASYRAWESKYVPPPPAPGGGSAEAQKGKEKKAEAQKAEEKKAEGTVEAAAEQPSRPAAPEPLPVPEGIRAGDILEAVEKAKSIPPAKAPESPAPVVAVPPPEEKAAAPAPPEPEVPPKDHVVEAIHEEQPWTKQLVKTPEPEVVHGNVDLTAEPLRVPETTDRSAAVDMEPKAEKPSRREVQEAVPEKPGFVPPPDEPDRPMLDRVLAAMPGVADCEGFCGYPSCRGYANALSSGGEFEHDLCDRGGKGSADRIALLLRKMKKKETVKTE